MARAGAVIEKIRGKKRAKRSFMSEPSSSFFRNCVCRSWAWWELEKTRANRPPLPSPSPSPPPFVRKGYERKIKSIWCTMIRYVRGKLDASHGVPFFCFLSGLFVGVLSYSGISKNKALAGY